VIALPDCGSERPAARVPRGYLFVQGTFETLLAHEDRAVERVQEQVVFEHFAAADASRSGWDRACATVTGIREKIDHLTW
jgi:hypothetical protein